MQLPKSLGFLKYDLLTMTTDRANDTFFGKLNFFYTTNENSVQNISYRNDKFFQKAAEYYTLSLTPFQKVSLARIKSSSADLISFAKSGKD